MLKFTYDSGKMFFCLGEHNVPDGEIGCCPDKYSANGSIHFESARYNGFVFNDIYLRFQKGKCVEYCCKEQESLEAMVKFDEGAAYLGEFAFGINPYINYASGFTAIDLIKNKIFTQMAVSNDESSGFL